MNPENENKLKLIKQNVKDLQNYIFNDNDVNNWRKVIIIYNIYLLYNYMQINYHLINVLSNSNNSFKNEFKTLFFFFYFLCSLKTSYSYFILNTSKIDYDLAMKFHSNLKEYF
jgi:hypothetical protein